MWLLILLLLAGSAEAIEITEQSIQCSAIRFVKEQQAETQPAHLLVVAECQTFDANAKVIRTGVFEITDLLNKQDWKNVRDMWHVLGTRLRARESIPEPTPTFTPKPSPTETPKIPIE